MSYEVFMAMTEDFCLWDMLPCSLRGHHCIGKAVLQGWNPEEWGSISQKIVMFVTHFGPSIKYRIFLIVLSNLTSLYL